MNIFIDERIKKLVMSVLGLLALFLLVISIATVVSIFHKDKNKIQNIISVTGVGEVTATPDIGTFTFTASERDKNASTAQQNMTKKVNDAIDYLKKQGIDEKDIKTDNYSTNPNYDYLAGKQTLSSYQSSETVTVKVRDVSKAGSLLTGIANLKIGNVSSLSFTTDDTDTLKMNARNIAIKNASDQAKDIANALGVSLKGVFSYNEETPNQIVHPMYEQAMSMSSDKVGPISPQTPVGEQKVTVTVDVSYLIGN